jgi:hypothetical protein
MNLTQSTPTRVANDAATALAMAVSLGFVPGSSACPVPHSAKNAAEPPPAVAPLTAPPPASA